MSVPYVDGATLGEVLSFKDATDALEEAFGADALPLSPPRGSLPTGRGELLLMPAAGEQGAGVKLVTVNPPNVDRGIPLIQGVYVLFDTETLTPRMLFDAAGLTRIRTAAVSALATRFLASDRARRLMIFGAGVQGRAHFDALRVESPPEWVGVVSRRETSAEALVEHVRALGIEAERVDASAIDRAEVVCTCTTSSVPLFDGAALSPGTHINAVGTHQPDRREVDSVAMARAEVVVETIEAARREAGDVLLAAEEGVLDLDRLVTLTEVVRGERKVASSKEVTVFKSVGVGFEDLIVAAAAARRIEESGT